MEKTVKIAQSPENMKEFRKKHEITLKQVSFHSKIPIAKIAAYEKDMIVLDNTSIYKILSALDKLSKM